MAGRPVIAWLGRPPPPELSTALAAHAWIRTGWHAGARVAAVWGDAQPTLLSVLPEGQDRPPVLVACEGTVGEDMRDRWEKAGVDQVVALSALSHTLREWIEGSHRIDTAVDDPPTFQPENHELLDDVEPSLKMLSGPVYVDQTDPFPPLRMRDMTVPNGEQLRRYVLALERYLERRDEVVRLMGEDGLTRFLELTHLREQVPASLGGRNRLDPYGRGRHNETPDWKVIVRRMKPRANEIEVSEGRMYAIGTDGVVLVTLFAAAPRQRLLVDLPYDVERNIQFIYEARWQRRVGFRRWHVGALLVEMRTRRLDGKED